jgi:hypothetical protein
LRTILHLKYPGLCVIFFEMMLRTVIDEVLGWDLEQKKQVHKGLFGRINTFSCSIEEQGRSTLQAHILIWVAKVNKMRDQIHHPVE